MAKEEQREIGKKLDEVNKNLMASRKAAEKDSGDKSKDVKEERFDKKAKQAMVDTLVAIKSKLILSNDQLKSIGLSLAKSLKTFGAGLIKKPIDAAKGIFGAISEFLKLGALLLGGIQFLEGWEKASLWFGANADIWDRISSGFAGILAALGFTDDAEATAKNISVKVHWIVDKIKIAFGTVFDAVKNAIETFQKDGFLASVKSFGSDILASKEAMILIGVLFGGKILTAVTGIVGALGTIIPVLTTIAFKIGTSLVSAVAAMSTGLTAMVTAFGPVLLIVAGFAAAVAAIWWVLKDLKSENSKLKAIWETVKNKVNEIYNNIAEFFIPVIDGMKASFMNVKEILSEAWTKVMNIGTTIKNSITDAIDNGLTAALDGFNVAVDFTGKIVSAVTNAVDTVIEKGFDVAEGIKTRVMDVKNSIIDSIVSIFDGVKNTFSAVTSTIGELIKPSTLLRIIRTDATIADVFAEKLAATKGEAAPITNTARHPVLNPNPKIHSGTRHGANNNNIVVGGDTHITNNKNNIANAKTNNGRSHNYRGGRMSASGLAWSKR